MNGTNGNEPGYPENALVPLSCHCGQRQRGDPDAKKIVFSISAAT